MYYYCRFTILVLFCLIYVMFFLSLFLVFTDYCIHCVCVELIVNFVTKLDL